jgi:hypothetical protein
MISVFAVWGFVKLRRAWLAYRGYPATAERLGQITRHLCSAGMLFTAVAINLAVMFGSQFDPIAMGWSNIAGLTLILVAIWLEPRIMMLGKRWYTRHRFTSPDFEEDAGGNPVRPRDAGAGPGA